MTWESRVARRRLAYQRLFLTQDGKVGPDAEIVLADLRRFCYVDRSTMIVSPISRITDTHATFMAEGRRETWVRIQSFLKLGDRQIANLQETDE